MKSLEPFFVGYIALWSVACLVALGLVVMRPAGFEITGRAYWRYLLQPWKLATFAVAAAGITLIAPWTGDPTWDYFDALMMSVLTFASAPWAVGTLYRALRGRAKAVNAYVALVVLLDNSYSMEATDPAGTRFTAAVESACTVINQLPRGSEVAVILTGGRPTPLFESPTSQRELSSRVKKREASIRIRKKPFVYSLRKSLKRND